LKLHTRVCMYICRDQYYETFFIAKTLCHMTKTFVAQQNFLSRKKCEKNVKFLSYDNNSWSVTKTLFTWKKLFVTRQIACLTKNSCHMK
jgi:hypothetical protein